MTTHHPGVILTPHHDTSALCVPHQHPGPGDQLALRVLWPNSFGEVHTIRVRYFDSGDTFLGHPATPEPSTTSHNTSATDTHTWWQASIPVANNRIHYRFLIDYTPHGGTSVESVWLTAKGITTHIPEDRDDFVVNCFHLQPRTAKYQVMYQIFPDRFARSSSWDARPEPPAWAIPADWSDPVDISPEGIGRQFYGGDLYGVIDHLDHLSALGVTQLYLTPFFPGESNHRYNAESFDTVDPLLGGDEALIALVREAHKRGISVLGDITTNHVGSTHQWFVDAHNTPGAATEEFFYFLDDQNSDYASWFGVSTLPKLNWGSEKLRTLFSRGRESIIGKWLSAPYNLDGWRVDVANMTGRHLGDDLNREVAREIRQTMDQVNPNTILLAEFTGDPGADVDGDGWQGAITYQNFTRPLWSWLGNGSNPHAAGLFGPGPGPTTAREFVDTYQRMNAVFPWHIRQHNVNAIDTHDSPRFISQADPDMMPLAISLQFCLPGIPLIWMGDEWLLPGMNGEASRYPMPWEEPEKRGGDLTELYATLSRLRLSHDALINGGIRFVYADDTALAFIRETDTETLLVAVNASDTPIPTLPRPVLGPVTSVHPLIGHGHLTREGVTVEMSSWRSAVVRMIY